MDVAGGGREVVAGGEGGDVEDVMEVDSRGRGRRGEGGWRDGPEVEAAKERRRRGGLTLSGV
jgi:hypothetical protein